MLRNVIALVLTVIATAAGVWAGQVKSGVEEVQTIDVIASQFKFEPATISVVEGDRVRLRLRSADRSHAFAIKAFRVKALIPKGGRPSRWNSWPTRRVRSISLAPNTAAPAIPG